MSGSGEGREDDWLRHRTGRGFRPRDIRMPQAHLRRSGSSQARWARGGAASGRSEAVVKVISFAGSRASTMSMVDYVTRKGELELETKDGLRLEGREEEDGTKALVTGWSATFRDRANARNAAHLMVSAPEGSDPEALRRAARAFGERAFADEGYDYGFAVHTDEAHPHAHFVVVRTGRGAVRQLNWNKHDLQDLRTCMAECACEQGIAMTATPRLARGVQERGEKIAARKVREREGASRSDLEAAKDALAPSLAGVTDRPWETRAAARLAEERETYEDLARHLASLHRSSSPKVRTAAGALLASVNRQAMALRLSGTRREHMRTIALRDDYGRQAREGASLDALCAKLARTYRAEREAVGPERTLARRVPRAASPEAMERKLEAFDERVGEAVRDQAARGDSAAAAVRGGVEAARRQTTSWVEEQDRLRREREDRDIGDDYEM